MRFGWRGFGAIGTLVQLKRVSSPAEPRLRVGNIEFALKHRLPLPSHRVSQIQVLPADEGTVETSMGREGAVQRVVRVGIACGK